MLTIYYQLPPYSFFLSFFLPFFLSLSLFLFFLSFLIDVFHHKLLYKEFNFLAAQNYCQRNKDSITDEDRASASMRLEAVDAVHWDVEEGQSGWTYSKDANVASKFDSLVFGSWTWSVIWRICFGHLILNLILNLTNVFSFFLPCHSHWMFNDLDTWDRSNKNIKLNFLTLR